MKKINAETIRYTFIQSIPVMTGYLVMGIGFGILLQSRGYPWWWATLMCVTIYGGSMQYAAVDILSSCASLITTAIITVMINIRYVFYSIALIDKYRDFKKEKPRMIFEITDETFSIVCTPDIPENVDKHSFFSLLSFINHCYWIIGGTLGAGLGSTLMINTAGVDFSMTAIFVVVFVEQWEKSKNHLPAIIGLAVSAVCLVIFGAERFLVPSMLGITAALFAGRKFFERGEIND